LLTAHANESGVSLRSRYESGRLSKERGGRGRQVVTSTTSKAGPNDQAGHQSIGQHVLETGQSARAAALRRTTPTSTSHQLGPRLRRCRSMRTQAPLRQLLRLRSSSVSSWTPSSAALPLPRKAARRTLAKRQGAHDYLPISISCHRPRSLATSPGRFAIWIAERDHRALLLGMAVVIGGGLVAIRGRPRCR